MRDVMFGDQTCQHRTLQGLVDTTGGHLGGYLTSRS
jgi:hypothetical protein